jgi:hypothetical protein
MIHTNHKRDSVVYHIKSMEVEGKDDRVYQTYEYYTKCWCGAITPIPCYMINIDEMCSILSHRQLKGK